MVSFLVNLPVTERKFSSCRMHRSYDYFHAKLSIIDDFCLCCKIERRLLGLVFSFTPMYACCGDSGVGGGRKIHSTALDEEIIFKD